MFSLWNYKEESLANLIVHISDLAARLENHFKKANRKYLGNIRMKKEITQTELKKKKKMSGYYEPSS